MSEGQGVFLDLGRDDYSAIPLQHDTAEEEDHLLEVVASAFEHFRKDLIGAHLVAPARGDPGNLLAYKSIVRPNAHLFDPEAGRAFGLIGARAKDVDVSFRDVMDFLAASQRASRMLKRRHIRDIVRSVRDRKAGVNESTASAADLRRDTALYRMLRPWYPRSYLCLYDALALIEFLAARRLFPTWIFGVQTQPFGAHCWLQAGDLLLNESMEYVGQFTPIMAA